ncbi:hypothetical protein OBBRIDRAFT_810677 [Obba rivulosa]|uniref:Protein ZIP4 homolog n=1 Tax=Obba rivulosa TaxID=1052685 RepID=A0A8E2J3S6_9APHY|nr:hypothetical protein OBBRIDRAFT_810677 [Obba rivulosa]
MAQLTVSPAQTRPVTQGHDLSHACFAPDSSRIRHGITGAVTDARRRVARQTLASRITTPAFLRSSAMSANKRKLSSDLEEIYQSIQDILIVIKPKLNDTRQGHSTSLRVDLHQIAVLAETFTSQRPRSNKKWLALADGLDRQGVWLWNASALIQEGPDDECRAVFAACEPLRLFPTSDRSLNLLTCAVRLAGFRLVEAGLEQKPGVETLIHVLQLASKAGASLSETGSNALAASVLACAAKVVLTYEESLRGTEDSQGLHSQAKARATVQYYSSRMEAAWREKNDAVAEFMLQKITGENRHRESLAAKLLQIGKSLLKAGSRETERGPQSVRDSLKWLQRAFTIIEPLENAVNTPEGELKRSILRSLARAYYLSSSEEPENLARAEASLQELLVSIDTADQTTAEFQQLRWMRVAVLKRRKATSSALLDAFRSIVDHMAVTESNITDILQELRTLSQDQVLVTTVHYHCLQRALDTKDESSLPSVERLLLSLIFHCSKDENCARAMKGVREALERTSLDSGPLQDKYELNQAVINMAELDLSKVAVTACLTLLWQFGDRQYNIKRWSEAADWFLAGTHHVFRVLSSAGYPKCLRKAALCYIQLKDYARASATVRRCSEKEAATHYILLLIAVHQAISSVRDMANTPDFNPKMLLLATQLANEFDMKPLLLSVLEALLRTMRDNETPQTSLEAVTLVRCIIRLVLKLMAEPAANRTTLTATLIGHYKTATALIANLIAQQSAAIVAKDISWLWRTAYNSAVQGCSEWEDSEESVSIMFDLARQLLEAYCESSLTDVDAEVRNHIINASFAAVAGRGGYISSLATNPLTLAQSSRRAGQALRELLEEITACKKRIRKVTNSSNLLNDDDILRTQSLLHVLRVFETETLCQLKDWSRLLNVIEELVRSDALALNTFEAIADILWVEKGCPVEVLFAALEAILHASLDRTCLSVEKFSRWLRAICTILLSRNTTADRAKAIGYVEQAVSVLEDHAAEADTEDIYPVDERQWLLGTSYNTGIECLHASLLDEAKRWFEAATTACRFVPDGGTRATKISETYAHLLARYTSSHSRATLGS